MQQKLILPINNAKLTASIDTKAYFDRFGFRHYGSDMVSTKNNTTVYASGTGKVIATGWDNACGNIVVVVYHNAYNRRSGQCLNITVRYFHLASVDVYAGQNTTKDTKLGNYGQTGLYGGTGAHIHMEADTDTRNVLYTPTLRASNYLRGTQQGAYSFDGPKNTVINMMDFLHCKTSFPDLQTYITAGDAYIRIEDKSILQI